ncbi:SiaC domain-containing protein [Azospirillaceae bacterium]
MDAIKLEPTKRTPGIDFNFAAGTFSIYGESYPEDVNKFFGPLISKLEEHFESLSGGEIAFTFNLIYFNSTTAKILMSLFETLENTASAGNAVTVSWCYDAGDSNMEELGEEFAEDFVNAKFIMAPKS